ncbi:hypothetical protein ACH5RR_038408 [Cinchona calisaya]|uniref:CCT domain-containing protein n=1 Tax=Cinchona calisaya TaxID=153742 RepID=A0ABD2Y0N1_9GENT
MASDLFLFDSSFFSYPFSPNFSDSSSIDPTQQDFFQTFEDNNNNNHSIIQENNSVDDETTISLEQIASVLFSSSSPPSNQLENLSISQTTHNFPNATNSDNYSPIKTEEFQVPFNNSFLPQNNTTAENVVSTGTLIQRSYSSNSFDDHINKPNFLFHPRFDSFMEDSSNLHSQQILNIPPDKNFSSCHMRRVCSTGDLQVMNNVPMKKILSTSPLSTEGSFLEEANFKVGRYTAEERKERIHRYRLKRTQRNFNKTIKYACRKTLADSRPRIRGRFARNDEAVEIPKTSTFNSRFEEEDHDIWIEGFHEEDEEGSLVGRSISSGTTFYNNFG